MLEIIFATILVIGGLFGAYCIVEYNAKLRRQENARFLRLYERLHLKAERQRSATEMAAVLMMVENEYRRR